MFRSPAWRSSAVPSTDICIGSHISGGTDANVDLLGGTDANVDLLGGTDANVDLLGRTDANVDFPGGQSFG